MEENTLNSEDIIKVIIRRKWIIISCFLLCLVCGLAIGILKQHVLPSQKREVNQQQSQGYLAKISVDWKNTANKQNEYVDIFINQKLESCVAIAKSATLLEKVSNELKLDKNIKQQDVGRILKISSDTNKNTINFALISKKDKKMEEKFNVYIRVFMEEVKKVFPNAKIKISVKPYYLNKIDASQMQTQVAMQILQNNINKKLIIVVSVFLGIMIGFAIVFILEYRDNSIRKREEAEKTLNLPTLAIIDENEREESYRSLRTILKFTCGEGIEESKVFMITSPSIGDGKTTITVNLAKSLSMIGHKTLIIDANGRNPMVNKKLNLEDKKGLCNILHEKNNLKNFNVSKTGQENLFALSWGDLEVNPGDAFEMSDIKAIIENLKKEYEYILIDTSAFTKYAEGQILAKLSNKVIIVVTEYLTNRSDAARMKELMDIIGIKKSAMVWAEKFIKN